MIYFAFFFFFFLMNAIFSHSLSYILFYSHFIFLCYLSSIFFFFCLCRNISTNHLLWGSVHLREEKVLERVKRILITACVLRDIESPHTFSSHRLNYIRQVILTHAIVFLQDPSLFPRDTHRSPVLCALTRRAATAMQLSAEVRHNGEDLRVLRCPTRTPLGRLFLDLMEQWCQGGDLALRDGRWVYGEPPRRVAVVVCSEAPVVLAVDAVLEPARPHGVCHGLLLVDPLREEDGAHVDKLSRAQFLRSNRERAFGTANVNDPNIVSPTNFRTLIDYK